MAKAKTQPSKRSRAARRATSPSINTDKSLKAVQPPPHGKPADRPSVLAAHHAAGVQKRSVSHRKTHLSAKARRRREKGMEMAEAVMARTSSKVQRSLHRQRTVDYRRKAWDVVNKDVNEAEEDDEDDEEMEDEVEVDGVVEKKKNKAKKQKKAADQDKEDGWETDENGEQEKTAEGVVDDGLDEIL